MCLPQGVILYGEPGTGKTLLAKAVANSTSATFLRVVGSELIQKYLGDGPKLVRELFRVADELSPSIVFIGMWEVAAVDRFCTILHADCHQFGFCDMHQLLFMHIGLIDAACTELMCPRQHALKHMTMLWKL